MKIQAIRQHEIQHMFQAGRNHCHQRIGLLGLCHGEGHRTAEGTQGRHGEVTRPTRQPDRDSRLSPMSRRQRTVGSLHVRRAHRLQGNLHHRPVTPNWGAGNSPGSPQRKGKEMAVVFDQDNPVPLDVLGSMVTVEMDINYRGSFLDMFHRAYRLLKEEGWATINITNLRQWEDYDWTGEDEQGIPVDMVHVTAECSLFA